MKSDTLIYAEVHTAGEKLYLPLDEIEHRLRLGQIGLDAHIDCPELTGDNPKPIWMIEKLALCADTPESRMMEHLREDRTPWTALLGLLVIVWAVCCNKEGGCLFWIRELAGHRLLCMIVGGHHGHIGYLILIGCIGLAMVYSFISVHKELNELEVLTH